MINQLSKFFLCQIFKHLLLFSDQFDHSDTPKPILKTLKKHKLMCVKKDGLFFCCFIRLVFIPVLLFFGAQNNFFHCQIEDYNYTQIFLFEQKTNFWIFYYFTRLIRRWTIAKHPVVVVTYVAAVEWITKKHFQL